IFTYDYEGATHNLFGIQRQVQIDAAMLLQDPSLIGFEILGISVDIPTKEGCSCDPVASAWLTKKLQVAGEYNLPDLQQVNGEIKNYGTESEPELRLDLSFPEPYKLTEEGIYVGYSVTVTNCNVPGSGWTAKYPIVTVCDIDKPECFMIHCDQGQSTLPQKYPEWTNLGTTPHQALAMRVIMRGSVPDNAASLNPLQTLYVAPGTTGQVYAVLNNYGITPISSIEYSYTVEGATPEPLKFTKELNLDTPVTGQIGAYTTIDLPFEAPDVVGKYSVELRVNKVNGVPNEYTSSTILNMDVVPFLPVNRPLLEDCTGLWCGYCPEVYVYCKQMKDKYGEEFLPITYHISDRLQSLKAADFPWPSYGLPSVFINNRNENTEPFNIESVWSTRRRELAPADISVDLFWNDEEHTALRAESKVKFIYDDPDADYMVTYVMVEDNMSNPNWKQANKFYDKNVQGPYWDLFCGQAAYVTNLVYDDVVVNFPDTRGIKSSLPSSIEGETEYLHSSVLYLKDAICEYISSPNYQENIILDPDKLRIVAILIDGKTGNVCNAATTGYSKDAAVFEHSGVEEITTDITDSEIISTEYYSLSGIKLCKKPTTGAMIIVNHLANGHTCTEKIVR
ncbi:MAG: hypothetical protein K2K97_08760, partial [Muribaculaceae bacterium]|nr:hypothetical protein [Muribaculaceae bacterium]